ncbi:MAG TPA: hypothetical protein VEQ85_15215, partial [Lacipirellulaceae bacterium]|nr:hypothetical protein [Lacipirellulaceae bacterium]
YDDVNQREWLDLTESRLSMYSGFSWEQRFASLLPELEPGKTFAGFAVATGPHLIALAESAGIHIGTSNFLLNGDPVRRLLDLVGSTRNGFPLEGRAALGLLNDVSSPTALLPNTRISGQLEYFPFAGSGGRAQLSVAPGYRDVAVSASIRAGRIKRG